MSARALSRLREKFPVHLGFIEGIWVACVLVRTKIHPINDADL